MTQVIPEGFPSITDLKVLQFFLNSATERGDNDSKSKIEKMMEELEELIRKQKEEEE